MLMDKNLNIVITMGWYRRRSMKNIPSKYITTERKLKKKMLFSHFQHSQQKIVRENGYL